MIEAKDGHAALAQVKGLALRARWAPDAVILDVMMPGIDGLQTCQILRGQEDTADLPVIMLSAKATPEAIADGLQAGALDFPGRVS